jgi:2-polyprenyl-3-methyl-5-hydroxy-6-metoxy-1,4-benzoquinol methylase
MEFKENLDQHVDGYEDRHIFSYDMKIWMDWYVKRLKSILIGNNCLELGIGHGYTTNEFSKYFENYTVIEGSQLMIERYVRLFPLSKVNIQLGYFEDFDPKEKYDIILMGYVLEHVENPKQILIKYKQYLSKNGSIFLVVPNGSALNRRFGLKAGLLKSLDEVSDFDYKCGHKRTFTYETLMQLISESKLKIVRQEGIFLKCMTTQQMIELKIPDSIINAMCEVAIDYPELAACILVELKNY